MASIDEIRERIQQRPQQTLAEAEHLRAALTALDDDAPGEFYGTRRARPRPGAAAAEQRVAACAKQYSTPYATAGPDP